MELKRIGSIVLGIVVVLALTAAASASAATMPVIVNSKGETPVKTGFTGTSGSSVFETKGGSKITCEKDSISGKITGASTNESTIKFTGCSTTLVFTLKCQTGATKGEIVLKVNGELVWLNSNESSEPGEDLVLPAPLAIECTGIATEKLKVRGSTLCPVSPFKTLSKTATITCKQTKGVQEFTKYFLGGTAITDITETEGSGVKTFPYEQSGLAGTDSLTFEEEVETH